jgi:acetyl esterase/lipase
MKNQSTILAAFVAIMLFTASCKKEDSGRSLSAGEQVTQKNVSYGTDTSQRMDVYLPAGRATGKTKIMVLVHGGAWSTGDKGDFNDVVAALRSELSDYAIFNINYRLVLPPGVNLWPAQGDDVASALNFIVSKRNEYQCNTDKIVLIGASAGAHLALLQAYRNNANGKIKAVVDLFGPTDIASLYASYANNPTTQFGLSFWLNGTPTSNPTAYTNASPINFVTAQSPPTIIFHGTADDVVPIGQSANLREKLQIAGVTSEYYTYAGEGHGWQLPNLLDTYTKAIAFIKKYVP